MKTDYDELYKDVPEPMRSALIQAVDPRGEFECWCPVCGAEHTRILALPFVAAGETHKGRWVFPCAECVRKAGIH